MGAPACLFRPRRICAKLHDLISLQPTNRRRGLSAVLLLGAGAVGCAEKASNELSEAETEAAGFSASGATSQEGGSSQGESGASAAAKEPADGGGSGDSGSAGASTEGTSAAGMSGSGAPGNASGGTDAESGGAEGGAAEATGGSGPALEGETVFGDACTFTVKHTSSPEIGTVEIVSWSSDFSDATDAHIDFGLTGAGLTMSAPVDLNKPNRRTLLVGMKGDRSYTFRIVLNSADGACTSPDSSFTTGSVPDWVPTPTLDISSAGASEGFIITTPGIDFSVGEGPRGLPSAYVFDTDGDVVWWSPDLLLEASRAHLSWDGETMWILNLANASEGRVFMVSMDGMTTTEVLGLERSHHDFTVLPEGGIATVYTDAVVEVDADGTMRTVVADLGTLYEPDRFFHANAIHYYEADDSYTLSDRYANLFVKFTRDGELIWQLGGANPVGEAFDLLGLNPWLGNHGHHMTGDGHFLFFNNYSSGVGDDNEARVVEVLLDETNFTAKKTWEYDLGGDSPFLGDVERLPNGNALVTDSMGGVISEVSPAGEVVQSYDAKPWGSENGFLNLFGYADFRTSLYGPPPR